MDEQFNESKRPVNPRRRKRTKMQIFKETYLPVIIAGLALVLIIVFIIGAITRRVQKNKAEEASRIAESSSIAAEQARLEQAAQDLIVQAENLIVIYDYEGAIALLNSFEGDISKFPIINDKILECEAAQKALVPWDDPNLIPNLSFQLLIADPARGFSHRTYGNSINRNFVTTDEFAKILQQLYDNGYILVNFEDFITTETGIDGTSVYAPKAVLLPNGKKPIMITQTNVNYNYYLIDSDGDKMADAGGAGIASKLIWDGSQFTCEMADANGNIVTGDFDLVPILEKFVAAHPDFSYQGAKATLAVTGYNGLFGYRTQPSAKETFGETAYQQAIQEAKNVAAALRNNGYTLACYTYENIGYGDNSLTQIKADLNNWVGEVEPILGSLEVFAFAQLSDITNDFLYSGEKFETLHELGFRYYLGFCNDGSPWAAVTDTYVHQGRIMVTGSNMAHHADWFTGLFDPASVLNTIRGNIPG